MKGVRNFVELQGADVEPHPLELFAEASEPQVALGRAQLSVDFAPHEWHFFEFPAVAGDKDVGNGGVRFAQRKARSRDGEIARCGVEIESVDDRHESEVLRGGRERN